MKYGFDGTESPNTGEVIVGWGDGKMASGEAVLCTEGLASCIGIAVYDPSVSKGYLSHVFPSGYSHIDAAVPMVETAVELSADRSKILAWVRGGTLAPSSTEQYKEQLSLREKTVNLLGRAGIAGSRLDVDWNNNPQRMVSMLLFCSKGTFMSYSPYLRGSKSDQELLPKKVQMACRSWHYSFF